MRKSWIEKRDIKKRYQVKINPKKFADIPAGSKMLIPTPILVDQLVNKIPGGTFLSIKQIREKLANNFNAEMTCPVVTGISIRIISEAAFEEYQEHENSIQITPFWRAVDPDSKLAGKLACGIDFIIERQFQEGIEL
tara:strand:- start:291 stop:701 length:411 start_codon:yes stop_codon:yes gene_type:complete